MRCLRRSLGRTNFFRRAAAGRGEQIWRVGNGTSYQKDSPPRQHPTLPPANARRPAAARDDVYTGRHPAAGRYLSKVHTVARGFDL